MGLAPIRLPTTSLLAQSRSPSRMGASPIPTQAFVHHSQPCREFYVKKRQPCADMRSEDVFCIGVAISIIANVHPKQETC